MATAIGIGISDAQAVITSPGFAYDPTELLAGAGIGVLDFDHLVKDQDAFAPYTYFNVDVPVMGTLLEWKTAQYNRNGRFDRFSRRWIRGTVQQLAALAGASRGVGRQAPSSAAPAPSLAVPG